MNKQELIEKIDNLQYSLSWNIPRINKEIVLDLIEQLDEPQKPVVPQFVGDWYEKNKDDFEGTLFRCIDLIPSVYEEGDLSEFESWVIEGHTEPFKTLVNMHQFGYTVEEEKRYRVRLKGIAERYCYLNYSFLSEGWFFDDEHTNTNTRAKHTRKQLEEASFGWIFSCEGIEVEEVE